MCWRRSWSWGSNDTVYGIRAPAPHPSAVIVGFGGVQLNGLYAQQSQQRPGREGVAINQAVFVVSKVAEIFIYLVFVFGVLLVLMSENDLISFSDLPGSRCRSSSTSSASACPTPSCSRPCGRPTLWLTSSPGPRAPRPGRRARRRKWPSSRSWGRRSGTTDMVLKLILVAVLFLMISSPASRDGAPVSDPADHDVAGGGAG